jgi:hypothetical protein
MLLVLVLAVAFLVGALLEIGPTSNPYRVTIDRSYGSFLGTVAEASNATAARTQQLLAGGASMQRPVLFADLDALVEDTSAEAHTLSLASPLPPTPIVEACSGAVAGHHTGAVALRGGLESLLGGATGTSPVEESASLAMLTGARQTLLEADALWESCRAQLRRSPGSPRVPSSVWVEGSVWSPSALSTAAQSMLASRSLAARHQLDIDGLALTPPPLPTGSTPTSALSLPPSSARTVELSVEDLGNVQEAGVRVQVAIEPRGGGAGSSASFLLGSLDPGGAFATPTWSLPALAGSSYTLVATASSTSSGTTTTAQWQLQLAVAAPGTSSTTAASSSK